MTSTNGRMVLIIVMLLAAGAGSWGCAVKARRPMQPLPREVRAQLVTVGLPVSTSVPEAHLKAATSGKGWGAAKGAGHGLTFGATPGLMIASGVRHCSGAAFVCGGVVAIGLGVAAAGGAVGALGGTIYGAITAESAATVDAAEIRIQLAFANASVQTTLRDAVLQAARERQPIKVVAIDYDLDYPAAASAGVDAALEVGVLTVRLVGSGIDPPLRLVMTAMARLARTADGTELYRGAFEYVSPAGYKLRKWADTDAKGFLAEVDRGTHRLAENIAQALFQADQVSIEGEPW